MTPITPATALGIALIAVGAIIAITGLVLATINLAADPNPFERLMIMVSSTTALLLAMTGYAAVFTANRD